MAHADQVLSSMKTDAMLTLAQELTKITSFKMEETPVARYLGEFFTARGYDVQLWRAGVSCVLYALAVAPSQRQCRTSIRV